MEVDITYCNEHIFKNIQDACNISKKYATKELSTTKKSTI